MNNTNNTNSTRPFSACPDWFPYHLAYPSTNVSNTLDMECPDTIIVPITGGIFYGIYVMIFVLCLIGLIWKRNSSQIRARSGAVLSFGLGANFTLVSLSLIRCIVGKVDFPCFLFSISFLILGPCFVLPSIMRGIRLIIQYKINFMRTKSLSRTLSNVLSEIQPIKTQQNTMSDKTTETISDSGLPNHETKSMKILMTLNRLLTSTLFNIIFSSSIIIIHLILWLSGGLIEDAYLPQKRFFMTNSSILSVSGCYTAYGTGILVSSCVGFYFLIDLVINLICLKIDRDTFNIKIETLVLTILRGLSALTYLLCSQIPVLRIMGRIISSVFIFSLYCTIEIVVTILIPSIKDCFERKMKPYQGFDTEIESILNDPKMYNILLDYARRSYSPENALFYKDVQYYKNLALQKMNLESGAFQNMESIENINKKISQFTHNVIHTYLREGSVNELNISNLKQKTNDLLIRICPTNLQKHEQESYSHYPLDLFDELLLESMITLMEVYYRLKQHDSTIREFSKNWKNQQGISE